MPTIIDLVEHYKDGEGRRWWEVEGVFSGEYRVVRGTPDDSTVVGMSSDVNGNERAVFRRIHAISLPELSFLTNHTKLFR